MTNHLLTTLALIISLPLSLRAQDKPAAAPQAPKPAAQDSAKPKPMARKHGPKRGEDARHCLEKPTSTEVIKCAEDYL